MGFDFIVGDLAKWPFWAVAQGSFFQSPIWGFRAYSLGFPNINLLPAQESLPGPAESVTAAHGSSASSFQMFLAPPACFLQPMGFCHFE